MSRIWCGPALPWGPAVQTFVVSKDDQEVLRSSLFWILMTRKRERIFRPDFGTTIPDAVHEPNDEILTNTLRSDVQEAITTYETNEYEESDPRFELADFKADRDGDTLNLSITVRNIKDPLANTVDVVDIALSPSYYNQGGAP